MMRTVLKAFCVAAPLLAVGGVSGQAAAQQTEAQPGRGQPVITREETFTDWKLVCGTPAGGGDERCNLIQVLVMVAGDQRVRVLDVEVGVDQGGPVITFAAQVALGITVIRGMSMQIDDRDPINVPFEVCFQGVCVGGRKLESGLLSMLKAGSKATISFIDARGQTIEVPVSLLGFTAGFAQVK